MKQRNENAALEGKPRVWSFELVLVIALPLAAVVACSITLYLALKYPAHESAMLDRFGHQIATQQH